MTPLFCHRACIHSVLYLRNGCFIPSLARLLILALRLHSTQGYFSPFNYPSTRLCPCVLYIVSLSPADSVLSRSVRIFCEFVYSAFGLVSVGRLLHCPSINLYKVFPSVPLHWFLRLLRLCLKRLLNRVELVSHLLRHYQNLRTNTEKYLLLLGN